jgi:hypothetical protein
MSVAYSTQVQMLWQVSIGSFDSICSDAPLGATFEENLSLQELGGPAIHCTNGTIDNLAENELVRK